MASLDQIRSAVRVPSDAMPVEVAKPIEQAILDLTRAVIAASAVGLAPHVIDSLVAAREYAEGALRGEGPGGER